VTTISRVLVMALALASSGVARADVTCAPAEHVAGDWTSYGGDIANSRYQAAEQLISASNVASLQPAWTFSAAAAGGAGDFTGTPVVASGCGYVGSNMGWVFAFSADTGEPVWTAEVPAGGVVNNSLTVDGDSVYAYVSFEGAPYVASFDALDGSVRWFTQVDEQPGSDAFASPIVHDGMVVVGVSGDAAQHGDESERALFFGSFVILDAATGEVLKKTWTIDPSDGDRGFAGATVTTSAAIDPVAKIAYLGTGSPFRPQFEHARANALLKVDVDRSSPTFGEILATYKGDTLDDVIPGYSGIPCEDLPTPAPPPIVPTGRGVGACGDLDVDFAASPNLFTGVDGRALVGTSQKSGVFHAADADTLEPVWTTAIGPAQPFGGVSAAYDGTSLYGGAAPPGYLVALDPSGGDIQWAAPIADGAHYGIPAASANGVVYSLGLTGTVNAYDATTGAPLLTFPLVTATGADGPFTFGGVSVARNTIYAAVGIQNTGLDPIGYFNGYVVGMRLP
jgi:polyvinyl alcohol dehydrogenase (cytochrome)